MFYREAGVFKTSYAADMALMPLPNTRWAVAGLTVLFIGIAQVLLGLGVFARNQFARWGGVTVLGLNSIAQLMFIPAYPFWSLAIFSLDILAIYGLVAYGDRLSKA